MMIQCDNHVPWQIPGAANDQDKMAALLESYERRLRSDLTESYERMVLEERSALSSAGVGFLTDTKQLQNCK